MAFELCQGSTYSVVVPWVTSQSYPDSPPFNKNFFYLRDSLWLILTFNKYFGTFPEN